MSVDARYGVRDVGGESKVGQPQVLYVGVTQSIMEQFVEAGTGEHGHLWVGKVKGHTPYARHFLEMQIPSLNYNCDDTGFWCLRTDFYFEYKCSQTDDIYHTSYV